MRSLLLIALLVVAGCEGPSLAPDASAPDAAPVGQGDTPHGPVALNEVSPAGLPGADWVELLNRSTAAFDLGGAFLTDEPDRLDHYYVFPAGTTLGPGERLLVYADDGGVTGASGLHAPFELSRAGSVELLASDGIPLDSLFYFLPSTENGHTLSRGPDGEGLFFPAAPTPGAANAEVRQ